MGGQVSQLMRAGFDCLSEGVVVFDRCGQVVYSNGAAARVFRRRPEELHGEAASSWSPHDLAGHPIPRSDWPVRRVLQTGLPVRNLIVGETGRGDVMWLRINGEPILEGGEVVGAVMSFADATESRRVSDALLSTETITRQLMEALADGVFVAQDFRFVFANPALDAMLGYPRDGFVGASFDRVIPAESYGVWIERYIHRIGAGPEPTRIYETSFRHADGERTIALDLVATRTTYGGRPAVLGVVRDITERKRIEAELARHRHGLEALVHERTEDARRALDAQREALRFRARHHRQPARPDRPHRQRSALAVRQQGVAALLGLDARRGDRQAHPGTRPEVARDSRCGSHQARALRPRHRNLRGADRQ